MVVAVLVLIASLLYLVNAAIFRARVSICRVKDGAVKASTLFYSCVCVEEEECVCALKPSHWWLALGAAVKYCAFQCFKLQSMRAERVGKVK